MLAAASDLHDVRFFSLAAVLATVLAAFFRRTLAGPVSTLANFFSHQTDLLECLLGAIQVVGGCFGLMLGPIAGEVKTKEFDFKVAAPLLPTRCSAVLAAKPSVSGNSFTP
jgi:hypothetical protein